MATQAIKDILGAEIPTPVHAHQPTAATPLHSEWTFSRSGSAWGFNYANGFVKEFADQTPRISEFGQGLVLNSSPSNLVSNPLDPTQETYNNLNIAQDGTRLGEKRWVLTPSGSNSVWHRIRYDVTLNDEVACHSSFLVRPRNGRYVAIEHAQTDGTNYVFPRAYFDLQAGETGVADISNAQLLGHDITEVAENWYLIHLATEPDSGWNITASWFEIVDSDGGTQYTADGSNTIEMITQQVASGSEAPHLHGGGTVNGESLKIFTGGQPSWYNPFNVTVYCEFELLSPGFSLNQGIIEGGTSGQMYIRRDGLNEFTVRAFDSSNGSVVAQNVFSAFQRVRAATGQFDGTKRVAAGGVVDSGPSTTSLFDESEMQLITSRGDAAVRVYDVRVFGRLLTEQEMKTLTA